ncbi:MAG: hypothetical protein AAGC55_33930, partial [Myxococcota bacterium]
MAAVQLTEDIHRVLDSAGAVLADREPPDLADGDLRRIMEVMLLTRMFDQRMVALHDRGRLDFYMSAS